MALADQGHQYRRAAKVGTVAGLICMGAIAPGNAD